jgi:c-di-GMP-binding flagellar brake protein YcgR
MTASLSNDQIEDKYFLLGKMEILNILNELAHRREPVTVYFNGGNDFILTILLAARPDALVFDLGGDARSNVALARSPSCTMIALPDGIRVQFSGQKPERFMWGDEEAFWVPLPDRIIRLQRRDTFRNQLPIANPIKVKLYDDQQSRIAEWNLHDLSVGGFGAIADGHPKLNVGDTIAHARFQLDAKHTLDCICKVRHITLIDKSKNGRYQVGFSFEKLPHNMEVAVSRLIINIEYERHRLLKK